jgi:hypothetical protein
MCLSEPAEAVFQMSNAIQGTPVLPPPNLMAGQDKASHRRSWISGALAPKTKEKEKDTNEQPLRRTMSNASTRPTFAQTNRPTRSHSSQSIDSNESSVFESGRPLPYAIPPNQTSTVSLTSEESSPPIGHELSRTETVQPSVGFPPRTATIESDRPNRSTNRLSLASFLTLGLLRDRTTEDPDRGRPISTSKDSSRVSIVNGDSDRERSRGRSTSPFRIRSRSRNRRDPSPSSVIEALTIDAESDTESVVRVRPRNAFSAANDESSDEDADGSEESWAEGDGMDELTAQHVSLKSYHCYPIDPCPD